ncbi:MAG: hypothetical protein ABSF46_04990 [Terriglobia bacterium]|jgi:hypothetical protein
MDNAARRLQDEIHQFLRDEVFMLTLMAVTQRGQIYAPQSTKPEDRDEFRRELHKYLDRMAEVYKVRVAEEDHLRNIVSLKEELSASCKGLHDERGFRIGSAQKALNLFLKYLWCLGDIPEPPHCPFDSRIINKLKELPKDAQCSWVQCDNMEHYKCWVAAARKKAEESSLSLAEWELVTYNNTP